MTFDKATLPPGPWHLEPDELRWIDPATGYTALAWRGPMGAWCGYVGVPKWHPAHGMSYGGFPQVYADAKQKHFIKAMMRGLVSKRLALLFARLGGPYTIHQRLELVWLWLKGLDLFLTEPKEPTKTYAGELIDNITVHGGLTYSGEDPSHKTKDKWFLGFDCSHYNDLTPGLLLYASPDYLSNMVSTQTYRDIDYVKAEILALALQLHAIEKDPKC